MMSEWLNSSDSDAPVSRKRKAITLEMKLDIIKRSEQKETITNIARAYDSNRSTIATIIKNKERILDSADGAMPLHATIISKKRSNVISQMEKLLVLWIKDHREKRLPFSLIQEKARSLYNDLKKKLGDRVGDVEPFAASRGWFSRFKARANLPDIIVSGESDSTDEKAAAEFVETFAEIIKQGNYSQHQIFNVDETGLFWKKMPDNTQIAKEEKCMPGFKAGKDRITLLLGGNAAGDFKLKPLLVYHSDNPRALKGVGRDSLPAIWMTNPKTWVTMAIFEDWFYHHFIPEIKLYCVTKGIPFKILLVLDNAPGHPAHLNDFHPDVKVIFLPPNIASLLQPMDQGVIRIFQAFYMRQIYDNAAHATERTCTFKDMWRSYNIYSAVLNIKAAWDEVNEITLNGAWKKITPHLVHTFAGFEEMLQGLIDSIVRTAKQLGLEMEPEDVDKLLDSHADDLSNKDLMELEAQEIAETENTAEEVLVEVLLEGPPPKRLETNKMTNAFRMIECGLALLEEQDPNSSRFADVSRTVSNAIVCYRETYAKKKKKASVISVINLKNYRNC